MSTPFLTHSHAMGVGGTGNIYITNSSGIPYAENSGSGYLQIDTALATWSPDATSLAANGNPVIQPVANTTRGANLNAIGGSANLAITNITFDGLTGNTNSGISLHTISGSLTFSQCHFRNSGTVLGAPTGTNVNLTTDRCVFESTTVTALDCGGTFTNYFALGNTYNCTGNAMITSGTPAVTYLHISVGADSVTNGNVNVSPGASGGAFYLSVNGTITKLEMDNTVINNYGGIYIPHGTAITSTHTLIHNNSCPGSVGTPIALSQSAFFSAQGDIICSDIQIYGNTGIGSGPMVNILSSQSSGIAMPPTGKTPNTYTAVNADAYNITCTGANLSIGPGNTWTALGTAPNIACIGTDGNYFNVATNISNTGTQAWGSTSNNVLLAQQFVTAAASSTSYSPYLANCVISMEKVGTGGGATTLTAYLYAASAGKPTGSALDTSVDTIPASTLTTGLLNYQFNFHGKYAMSPSTDYCIVLGMTGNTVDGTNYINVSTNTAYTGTGVLSTSPAVQSWTTTAVSMSFQVQSAPFGISGFKAFGDIYIGAVTSGSSVEGLIIASTAGGSVYDNLVYGGTIGIGTKNVLGSSTPANGLLIYSNLIQAVGSLHALQDKGSYGVYHYNNTIYYNPQSTGAGAFNVGQANGASPAVANPPYANYCTLENNIIYMPNQASANTIIEVTAINANPQLGNANFVSNYNCIFGGTNTIISDIQSTWAGWQGAGYDVNGINANPLLAAGSTSPTSTAGFIPAATSPALGIGNNTYTPAIGDYLGLVYTNPPDAGAISIAAYYRIKSLLSFVSYQVLWAYK